MKKKNVIHTEIKVQTKIRNIQNKQSLLYNYKTISGDDQIILIYKIKLINFDMMTRGEHAMKKTANPSRVQALRGHLRAVKNRLLSGSIPTESVRGQCFLSSFLY